MAALTVFCAWVMETSLSLVVLLLVSQLPREDHRGANQNGYILIGQTALERLLTMADAIASLIACLYGFKSSSSTPKF